MPMCSSGSFTTENSERGTLKFMQLANCTLQNARCAFNVYNVAALVAGDFFRHLRIDS
jgi:hypothetical protein